jgi:hypothetical protein
MAITQSAFPPSLRTSFSSGPLFAGAREREAYYQKLAALPDLSKHKLRAINREGHSDKVPPKVHHNVKHIFMAIKAALFDRGVQTVVLEIIALRRRLHRAKALFFSLHPDRNLQKPLRVKLPPDMNADNFRQAQSLYAKASEAMQDYHIAMDWMTGRVPYPAIPQERLPLVEDRPDDQLPG